MKITSVRIRKLVSRPTGYGHDACEMEATVEHGDLFEDVAARLHVEVDKQIKDGREVDKLGSLLRDMREDVIEYDRRLKGLQRMIAEADGIIRSNQKIQDLARAAGIPWRPPQWPFEAAPVGEAEPMPAVKLDEPKHTRCALCGGPLTSNDDCQAGCDIPF